MPAANMTTKMAAAEPKGLTEDSSAGRLDGLMVSEMTAPTHLSDLLLT
jgi:hypothetical protein